MLEDHDKGSHAQLIFSEVSQHLSYTPPPLIDWLKIAKEHIKNNRYSKTDLVPLRNRK
jgi:hypothetical protein